MKDSLVTSLVRVWGGTTKGFIWNAYINGSLLTGEKYKKEYFIGSVAMFTTCDSHWVRISFNKNCFMLGDFWHWLVWYQLNLCFCFLYTHSFKTQPESTLFSQVCSIFWSAHILKISELRFVLILSGWRIIWRSLWCHATPWHVIC